MDKLCKMMITLLLNKRVRLISQIKDISQKEKCKMQEKMNLLIMKSINMKILRKFVNQETKLMNKRISTKLNLMDFSNKQKMIMIQIKKYF
jgi:hypothetical protein